VRCVFERGRGTSVGFSVQTMGRKGSGAIIYDVYPNPNSTQFTPWEETSPVLIPHGGLKYQFADCNGFVRVYPNLLTQEQGTQVQEELLNFRQTIDGKDHTAFRKHRVQNQWEPRLQFMMHEKAMEDTVGSPQPGYSYVRSVVMKALRLAKFPVTQALSDQLEELFRCDAPKDMKSDENATEKGFFNIGVHALLYRGGRDAMGFHADDDHEESLIVTTIVMQDCGRTILNHIEPLPSDPKENGTRSNTSCI
jgi:hypothetical protein